MTAILTSGLSGLTSSTTPLEQRQVREGGLSNPDLGSLK